MGATATRSVVCGIDDSVTARGAARAAVCLAVRLGAELVAIHVPASRGGPSYGAISPNSGPMLDAATHLVANVVGEALAVADRDVPLRIHAAYGEPADVLRQIAVEEDAELVVVGAGQTGISAVLHPGVSRSLIADCPSPVVVVPERLDDMGLLAPSCWARSVICGVDYSDESAAAAQVAARVARSLGTRVTLAHVCRVATRMMGALPAPAPMSVDVGTMMADERRRAIRRLDELRATIGDGSSVDLETTRGAPAAGLVEIADREGCSLLAVGSRGRGALRRAFAGSVADALLTNARRPVLVVPPTAAASRRESRVATGGVTA